MSWSIIASASAESADTFKATTAGINTTGAKLIVVGVANLNATSGPLSDSYMNTWSSVVFKTGTLFLRHELFICENPTVGAGHTFTVDYGSDPQYPAMSVLALAGNAASPLDQTGSAQKTSSSVYVPNADTEPALSPTEDNEILVTGMAFYNRPNTITLTGVNGPFTLDTYVLGTVGFAFGSGLGYQIQMSKFDEYAYWTSDVSTQLVGTIASFKMSAGGSGNPWLTYAQMRRQ